MKTAAILFTQITPPTLSYGDPAMGGFNEVPPADSNQEVVFPDEMTDDGDPGGGDDNESGSSVLGKEKTKPTEDDSNKRGDADDDDDDSQQQNDDPDDEIDSLEEQQKQAKKAAKSSSKKKPAEDEEDKSQKKAKTEDDPQEKKDDKKTTDEEEDEDLKKLQPPSGVSPKIWDQFKTMKGMVKEARKAKAAVEAELVTLKEQASKPPENLTKLEEENKLLKSQMEIIHAGNHPEFQQRFSTKQKEADDSLINLLTQDPRLGMDPEEAKQLLALDLSTEKGYAALEETIQKVKDAKMPRLAAQIKAMADKCISVGEEKQNELKRLETDRDGFFKNLEDQRHKERQAVAEVAEKTIIELCADQDWACRMTPTKGDTKEQIAAAEAHNKQLDELVLPSLKKYFTAIDKKDGKTFTEAVYKAVRHDIIEKQVKQKDLEILKLQKRIEALEGDISGVQRVTRTAHKDNAPPADSVKTVADTVGGDADDAMAAYERQNGVRG